MDIVGRGHEVRMINKLFLGLLIVPLLMFMLGACNGRLRTLAITGETLDAVGQRFLETGRLYDSLLDAQRITRDEYRDWASFAKRFQLVYPRAVEAWKTGKSTDDTIELVLQLKSQLVEFYTYALNK